MRTRGDLLSFAVAFALRGARKLVRGFREELTEEERYRVADDVVHQLKQAARCHCDLGQILRSGFRRRFLCRFNGAH